MADVTASSKLQKLPPSVGPSTAIVLVAVRGVEKSGSLDVDAERGNESAGRQEEEGGEDVFVLDRLETG